MTRFRIARVCIAVGIAAGVSGLLIGALIVELHVGTERHRHPTQSYAAEAMEMLSDYKKGQTIGHRRVTAAFARTLTTSAS